MASLRVNLDHIATVRQTRRGVEPDPLHAAVLAELGGAAGITVHLRADRRHVQDRDVELLRQAVKTRLNVAMAATQEMVRIALTVKPDQVTLVPERPDELTTEGGLDVILNEVQLKPVVRTLQEGGIDVCLFVDPDLDQVKQSHRLGVQQVEINVASWADAADAAARQQALRGVREAVQLGVKLSLDVQGGHGLTYRNVGPIAALPGIGQLDIGHAIVARAVLVGMERAVRDMVSAIAEARAD